MSAILHDIALGLGYLSLFGMFVFMVLFVGTLVIDAFKPRQAPRKPITVDRYGPFLSPHPLHRPVLHVEHAPDEASAWAAILEKSA